MEKREPKEIFVPSLHYAAIENFLGVLCSVTISQIEAEVRFVWSTKILFSQNFCNIHRDLKRQLQQKQRKIKDLKQNQVKLQKEQDSISKKLDFEREKHKKWVELWAIVDTSFKLLDSCNSINY